MSMEAPMKDATFNGARVAILMLAVGEKETGSDS